MTYANMEVFTFRKMLGLVDGLCADYLMRASQQKLFATRGIYVWWLTEDALMSLRILSHEQCSVCSILSQLSHCELPLLE